MRRVQVAHRRQAGCTIGQRPRGWPKAVPSRAGAELTLISWIWRQVKACTPQEAEQQIEVVDAKRVCDDVEAAPQLMGVVRDATTSNWRQCCCWQSAA